MDFTFQVCKEKHRFEKLMDYFRCEDGNIDFMVKALSLLSKLGSSIWLCRLVHRNPILLSAP